MGVVEDVTHILVEVVEMKDLVGAGVLHEEVVEVTAPEIHGEVIEEAAEMMVEIGVAVVVVVGEVAITLVKHLK